MSSETQSALIRVVAFLIIPVAMRVAIKRKKFTRHDIALNSPLSYSKFFLWWFGFLLFTVLTEITLYRFGILEVSRWHHNGVSAAIRLIGIIVLAPLSEELLFRGFFLHKLIQWKLNRHMAVLVQAAVFVLLHSFAYQNDLSSNIGIAQGFIDACIFAYARFSTGSIYTSMAMHSTGNLVAVIEQFIL